VVYPVDSTIQLLNSWGLIVKFVNEIGVYEQLSFHIFFAFLMIFFTMHFSYLFTIFCNVKKGHNSEVVIFQRFGSTALIRYEGSVAETLEIRQIKLNIAALNYPLFSHYRETLHRKSLPK